MERPRTDYLFATGSYLVGAGSIFNLAGSYFQYNDAPSGEEADARAIASDWAMVGQDMRDVMGGIEAEIPGSPS